MRNGQQSVRADDVAAVARWWTSATQEARFEFLRQIVTGERRAPPLADVQLAIYLAEVEAGEVSEG